MVSGAAGPSALTGVLSYFAGGGGGGGGHGMIPDVGRSATTLPAVAANDVPAIATMKLTANAKHRTFFNIAVSPVALAVLLRPIRLKRKYNIRFGEESRDFSLNFKDRDRKLLDNIFLYHPE